MHSHEAPNVVDVKRKMSGLRKLFYVGTAIDFLGLFALGATLLYFMPSKTGFFVVLAVLIPLALWHQSHIRKKMHCPNCTVSLYEWDGIALHAKKCSHCGVELR